MIVQSKAIVLVVISFLLVFILYSSIAQFYSVSAKPKITQTICAKLAPTAKGAAYTETCCQFIKGQASVTCNSCQYDSNGNQVGSCVDWVARQTLGGNSTNPPSLGTVLPPTNNSGTRGLTGNPPSLGNVPTTPSNNTVKPFPGSIFKVPPGTTNTGPSGNKTGTSSALQAYLPLRGVKQGNLSAAGTLPALTVTKEHNPASPNVLSLAGNATNPNNNTSTLKLSPLEGQQHHHKGSNVGGNNQTNSIQGHSHVTIQNNG